MRTDERIYFADTPSQDSAGGGTCSVYWPATDPVWQDVISVPAGVSVNGQVAPGRGPDSPPICGLHRHVRAPLSHLAHEGRGMMQLVRLVEAAIPGLLPGYIPEHH